MRRAGAALIIASIAALSAPAAAGASGWSAAQLPGTAAKVYMLGVSCPSQSLCVAVGTNNVIATSTEPTGGPGAWHVVYAGEGAWENSGTWTTPSISGRQIQGVSCPSPHLCVGVTDQGNIYTSTQPTGPPSAWKMTQIDGKGRNTHLFGVSCPTVSLCVAVSGKRADDGKILTSTDPTGGVSAWQSIELGEPFEFRGISCATPSFCVAVANDGRIVTSTDPTGDASAWSVIGSPGGPGSLRAVTCVAAPLCLSGNQAGNLLTSTAPAAGLSGWKETDGGSSVQITGVSCTEASECVAVDDNGDVMTSTSPTGGRSAWSFTNLMPYTIEEGNALFGASCPSSSLCALTGARGQIFTNSDPFAEVDPPAKKKAVRRPKRPRARIALLHVPYRNQVRHDVGPVFVRFYAVGKAEGFLCKIDGGPFKPCHSPRKYRLRVGRHVFRVRAIGLTGLRGPVASEIFWVGHHCTRHGSQTLCQN